MNDELERIWKEAVVTRFALKEQGKAEISEVSVVAEIRTSVRQMRYLL
jgi:hypothetical protein